MPESDDAHANGPPSNSNLNERLARVEEQQDQILESTSNIEQALSEMEDQHLTMWTVYCGSKWLIMMASGGGVLALVVQLAGGVP